MTTLIGELRQNNLTLQREKEELAKKVYIIIISYTCKHLHTYTCDKHLIICV